MSDGADGIAGLGSLQIPIALRLTASSGPTSVSLDFLLRCFPAHWTSPTDRNGARNKNNVTILFRHQRRPQRLPVSKRWRPEKAGDRCERNCKNGVSPQQRDTPDVDAFGQNRQRQGSGRLLRRQPRNGRGYFGKNGVVDAGAEPRVQNDSPSAGNRWLARSPSQSFPFCTCQNGGRMHVKLSALMLSSVGHDSR